MIIHPVTVTFSLHHLEAARRVIELAIANRATGKVRRNSLEDALDAIDAALKAVKEKHAAERHPLLDAFLAMANKENPA